MENYIGKIIDNRYEVLSLVGVGGMSNVYKAVDKHTGAEVAIRIGLGFLIASGNIV